MAEISAPDIRVQAIENSANANITHVEEILATKGRASPGALSLSNKLIRSLSGNPAEIRRESVAQAATDPVTQNIIERVSHENTTPQKTRFHLTANSQDGSSDAAMDPPVRRPSVEVRGDDKSSGSAHKEKKTKPSFLSRLRTGKKRDSIDFDAPRDDQSDAGEIRAEGADVAVFSQPIGYIPKFPEPPKYIRIKARGKRERDFDRLFLSQELRGRTGLEVAQAGGHRINVNAKVKHSNAIWAIEFSKDGHYLAAGGHGHVVRVWSVIATEADRRDEEKAEERNGVAGQGVKLSAPVFKSRPVQEYEGHTASVLALSWSKNNFLLSSSMDKTVRLWHISRTECLCIFKHPDFVPAVQFHPQDDRFFLAGSLDSKIRLWSIPDKNVAYSASVNDLITAVEFTPEGKTIMVGTLTGLCIFYDTEKLREQTRMHVRSAHGKNAKGSKITGIQAINYPPDDPTGEVKLLITSNDSRVRVYNLRDKSLELKLKGNENTTSQIRASFSNDARYIISGSEDKKCYIWDMSRPDKDREKHPMETFKAHSYVVTAAIMAPARTRQLLQASGDPVYEICNPPPVQLVSKDNADLSETPSVKSQGEGSVDTPTPSIQPDLATPTAMPGASQGFLARSSHADGHIIITADTEGRVKCFRSDCAYKNRLKNNENWDTGSTFSKKMLQRSSSIATRASRNSTSFRDSFVFPNDRILSWRQSIDRSSLPPAWTPSQSLDMTRSPSLRVSGSGARSSSPRKSMTGLGGPVAGRRLNSFASFKSREEQSNHPLSTSVTNTPAMSTAGASSQSLNSVSSSSYTNGKEEGRAKNGSSKIVRASDLGIINSSGSSRQNGVSQGDMRRRSDASAAATDDAERCNECGGDNFKAVKQGKGRGTRFQCANCGLVME